MSGPRPRRAGATWTWQGGRQPPQQLAGDSTVPPVESHRGRAGWPLPCAPTGAPPPTLQARARGHEHTHPARSPPFRAGSLAPPMRPRATCSRGRGARGGHTHLGGRGVGLVPALPEETRVAESIGCTCIALSGWSAAAKPSDGIVRLSTKFLGRREESKEGWSTSTQPPNGASSTFLSRERKPLDLDAQRCLGIRLFATHT